MTLPLARLFSPLALAAALAACTVGPDYQRPAVTLPDHYKEAAAAPLPGDWKPAEPADAALRGEWWRLFGDPELDALQQQARQANQNLQAAAARLAQARAALKTDQSARQPRVDAGLGPSRQRPSPVSQGLPDHADTQAATQWRAQVGIAYEADLFGRVARQIDAGQAGAEQSAALYQSVLLALHADVAATYFQVREYDAEAVIYRQTVALREQTLALIERRYDAGDIGRLDLARARTELAQARAEAVGVARQRALAEHALALLLGQPASSFSLPARPLDALTVSIPSGLPSALLERRPDIAAAERGMAAANARIGVAQAAFFPRLELTGALGSEASTLDNLLHWSSRTFLLGPLVGTALSLPLWDGGRRRADVERARAQYEEEVAAYRQTVLTALREVEDNLAQLRLLTRQREAQQTALDNADQAAKLSHVQYREGAISYLDVIEADRSTLTQRRAALRLNGEQARATVLLVRALGGGWELPTP